MLLVDKLKSYNLILASRSPRRRQLLGDLGLDFRIADDYLCDESYPLELPQIEVAEYIAAKKSKEYPFGLGDADILITADTVVLLADQILGKPKDRAEAIGMVRSLSGCTHTVVTGVVIASRAKRSSFSSLSQVRFRELSQSEIEYYVDTFKPFDKAGSYGIQEWIGYVGIESINGSFFNVMGLPTQKLYSALEAFVSQS